MEAIACSGNLTESLCCDLPGTVYLAIIFIGAFALKSLQSV